MKKYLSAFFFLFSLQSLFAEVALDNITLDGFLRTRAWYLGSRSAVPDKFAPTSDYKQISYQDLFFRNRLTFTPSEKFKVKSVFDVFQAYGESDFELGNGSANLITRNVYGVLLPTSSLEVQFGLQPFSLGYGHILARDGAGVQASQKFLNAKGKAYLGWIKAFDAARATYGNETNPDFYAQDNVYWGGILLDPLSSWSSDVYVITEFDNYTSSSGAADYDEDGRKADLVWAGTKQRVSWKKILLRAEAIVNAGTASVYQTSDTAFHDEEILAHFFQAELGRESDFWEGGFIAAGASGNIADPDAPHSFQDIKASEGLSRITIDNSGGLAIRPSGESAFAGLTAAGLYFKLFLPEMLKSAWNIDTRYFHFFAAGADKHFGDEWFIDATWNFTRNSSMFVEQAVFLPGDSYELISGNSAKQPIWESMLGIKLSY